MIMGDRPGAADNCRVATNGLSALTAALPRGGSLPPELWRSRHRALVLLLCLHAVLLPGWALLWSHPLRHALEGSLLLADTFGHRIRKITPVR